MAACTSSSSPASTHTGTPTLGEVSALLGRHAAAVRKHDRAAFDADLAGGAAAKSFAARQRAEFANLVKLPLTTWSYRVFGADKEADARAAARTRYGAPALIVEVTLTYALRGVDPIPTMHHEFWTFVRQKGQVRLAGDRDLDKFGGTSWQGPWDFGPLVVVTGKACLVLGHADDAQTLRLIADTVDAAVPAVTAVWGTDWTRDVAVLVPGSDDELKADIGTASSVTADLAALAVSDGQDPASNKVYGQRLVVEPDEVSKLSDVGLRIVYTHEVTHIATAADTSDVTPRWLVEGFADYVGNLHSGQSVHTAAAELRADVRAGKVPAALPSSADFDDTSTAAQAYEGSWLACRLIAAKAGQDGLVKLYRQVGTASGSAAAVLAKAVRDTLHDTPAQFVAQWRAYLRAQLG